MSKKIKVSDVKPQNENILIEVVTLDRVIDNIYVGNRNSVEMDAMPVEFYIAKVLELGPESTNDKQCPGIEKGDYAFVSHFAGHAVNTEEAYTKVVQGYNIVAYTKDIKMNIETIIGSNDRLIIKLLEKNKMDGEVFSDAKADPRDALTQAGEVISCGVNATQYAKGTIVYFDPYCGNLILDNENGKIKTLNSLDVLYTI